MLSDALLIKIAREMERRWQRSPYEDFLVESNLYSLHTLREDDTYYKLSKYNLILETLQSHAKYDTSFLIEVHSKVPFSKEFLQELVTNGINLSTTEEASESKDLSEVKPITEKRQGNVKSKLHSGYIEKEEKMPEDRSSVKPLVSENSFWEKAKHQLTEHIWEVFIGVAGMLTAILLNSIFVYILVIVVIAVVLVVIFHNTKFFPWLTFFVGVSFGLIFGIKVAPMISGGENQNLASPTPTTIATPVSLGSIVFTITPSAKATNTLSNTIVPTVSPTQTTAPILTMTMTDVPFGFSDNFNDGLSASWEVIKGDWFVSRSKALPFDPSGGMILAGDNSWTDYTVEVDIAGGDQDFTLGFVSGILVRAQDGENYIGFFIDCPGSSRSADTSVWRIAKDNEVKEVPGTKVAIGSGYFCAPRHYIIVVKENNYSVYTDNKLISSFAVNTFESGKVGLWSASYPDGQTVAGFDNFEVKK